MEQVSAAIPTRKNINLEYGCIKDPNTYCYRMNKETGEMKLKGIILGRGWEVWPLDYTALSCYAQGEEGEDTVVNKKEPPGKEELLEVYLRHRRIEPVAKELKVGWVTAKTWLRDAGIIDAYNNYIPQEQTPNPEPAQAANQEPDQGEKEPAPTSISRGCPFDEPVNMPLGCELPPEPERLSYTSSQYQEQMNGPEVNATDINDTKIQLIATVLAEYRDDKITADLTMKLVGKIKDMEVA